MFIRLATERAFSLVAAKKLTFLQKQFFSLTTTKKWESWRPAIQLDAAENLSSSSVCSRDRFLRLRK